MIKRIFAALCATLIAVAPAIAGDNAVIVSAGSGITMKSKDVGSGVQAMQPIIYDGTNSITIKAASTAAAQTDTALVVRNPDIGTIGDSAWVSGNGTNIAILKAIAGGVTGAIPMGTNTIGALVANQSVNTAQVNGVTTLTGTGATGTGAQRVTVSTDQATNAGAALVKGGVGVVNGGSFYEAVAASQTATVLQSSTGATGDYLSHCVIYPTSTSPGVVTVFDNTNTAANSAILFPGGASSLSNLAPIALPVGAVSVNGAWKVTTGASVSVVCYGKFS